jgi:Txe/YoeB family toxin of Txe-Axe toxin-antitoxin module
MKSRIHFATESLQRTLEALRTGTHEERELYTWIERALNKLHENAFCGTQVPKRLIPKEYIQRYGIDNLWKYNLPRAWRLLYAVEEQNVEVISLVIEWFDHKRYERRFNF